MSRGTADDVRDIDIVLCHAVPLPRGTADEVRDVDKVSCHAVPRARFVTETFFYVTRYRGREGSGETSMSSGGVLKALGGFLKKNSPALFVFSTLGQRY